MEESLYDKDVLVALNDPTTWPPNTLALVQELADLARRHPDYRPTMHACDLRARGPDFDFDADARLRASLGGIGIRMFHATRLLPHEVGTLRAGGLRALSEGLRRDKLLAARDHHPDLVSTGEIEMLLTSGPLTWEGHQARRGQIWVVAPLRSVLETGGFEELFGCWGGESIAWAGHAGDANGVAFAAVVDRLSRASTPAVVEVEVRATELNSKLLWPVMCGCLLDQPEAHNEWWIENVPALTVLDVITPEHEDWNPDWVDSDWTPHPTTPDGVEQQDKARRLLDAARAWLEKNNL